MPGIRDLLSNVLLGKQMPVTTPPFNPNPSAPGTPGIIDLQTGQIVDRSQVVTELPARPDGRKQYVLKNAGVGVDLFPPQMGQPAQPAQPPQIPGQPAPQGPQQSVPMQRTGGLLQNPQALQSLAQLLMATLGGRKGRYMARGAQETQQQQFQNQLGQQQVNQQGAYQQGTLAARQAEIQAQQQANKLATEARAQEQAKADFFRAMDDAQQIVKESGSENVQDRIQSVAHLAEALTPEYKRMFLQQVASMPGPSRAAEFNQASTQLERALENNPSADISEREDLASTYGEGLPKLYRDKLVVQARNFKPKPPGYDDQLKEAWLARNPGKGLVDFEEWRKTLGPAYNMNAQQQMLGHVLTPGTQQEMLRQVPDNLRASVEAIVAYRKMPPTGYALARSPIWSAAMNYALQIDPAWDEKEYPTRAAMMKNYTSASGASAGGQINAINTVLGHVAVLGEAVDALNNVDILALNRLAQKVKVEVGKSPKTTFDAIVNRVGPELTRAYVGTGGEQAEREINKSDFASSRSPQQLKDAIGITVKLLRSKIGSLENQWRNTMKRDDFEERFLTDEAKRAVAKWSPGETGPQGYQYTATDAKGNKVGWDGTKWVTIGK